MSTGSASDTFLRKAGFATKAVHGGQSPCPATGAVTTPIYQTSAFVFRDVAEGAAKFAGEQPGFIYSRLGNPTLRALEEKMALLEGGEDAAAAASGMAAISGAFLALASRGDHIVSQRVIYGSTHSLLSGLLPDLGIEVTFVDRPTPDEVQRALRPNTKVLFIETPSNPTLELVDLPVLAALARERGVITVVDNTFMSPYLQRPLEFGVDVVVHSATKYIGGHGDVIGGVVVGGKDVIQAVKSRALKDLGGILGPFDAWLLIRGLKTLPLRMEKHSRNALTVARFLAGHPAVAKVYYPWLETDPQYELAQRQMKAGGGVVSFELKAGYEACVATLNAVRLCHLAVSLGDVDTLIEHPASMTHSVIPFEERLAVGITDNLIRLAVGIEDAEDIIADLDQALEVCQQLAVGV